MNCFSFFSDFFLALETSGRFFFHLFQERQDFNSGYETIWLVEVDIFAVCKITVTFCFIGLHNIEVESLKVKESETTNQTMTVCSHPTFDHRSEAW